MAFFSSLVLWRPWFLKYQELEEVPRAIVVEVRACLLLLRGVKKGWWPSPPQLDGAVSLSAKSINAFLKGYSGYKDELLRDAYFVHVKEERRPSLCLGLIMSSSQKSSLN